MKVNVLVEGPIGTGKTYSLRTIVAAGQELFVVATEPGIASILGDIPCSDGCHWTYIPPGSVPWEVAVKNAEKLNSYSIEQIIKAPSTDKRDYAQLLDVFSALAGFKCDRCGEEFGPVDDWDETRTVAADGLTGLSTMAIQLLVGSKPIKSLPEWLGGQQVLLALINKLCHDTKCNFVLVSHVSRERDEVSGRNLITVSTLGKALAPEIIKPFDEIIFTRRVVSGKDAQFYWSTTEPDVDQKARILPWDDQLEPDFAQIFDKLKEMEEKGT